MNNLTSTLLVICILFFSCVQSVSAKSSHSRTRAMPPSYGPGTKVFNDPRYRGNRVDKCLYTRGDRQCGKPAADRYCQLNGYKESITYDLTENARTTFLLGSESNCSSANSNTRCDAFRAVACRTPTQSGGGTTPPPASQSFFNNPSVHGYPVDQCLYNHRDGGKPAANAFCQSKGYSTASTYRTGTARNSWMMKEGRLCNSNCKALYAVQCYGKSNSGPDPGDPGNGAGQAVLYENPKYRDVLIAECLRQGRDCGSAVATEFCRLKGHSAAISFRVITGQQARTWLLRDNRYCTGNQCNPMKSIRCTGSSNGNNNPGSGFYREPKYQGTRISRCLKKDTGCGQKAADKFCQLAGYRSAGNYERWRDSGPTIRLGNMQRCNKHSCDALKNIQCSYSPPKNDSSYNREQLFPRPSYRGYPISRCNYRGESCDSEAAREFCRLNGYNNLVNYYPAPDIGPTIRLGSKQLCDKRDCDGFEDITCSK